MTFKLALAILAALMFAAVVYACAILGRAFTDVVLGLIGASVVAACAASIHYIDRKKGDVR
jgi:hypothetical protein